MIHIKALGLEVRNMLGSGSFAQVFQCYDHRQKKEYAVKMIKKQTMTNSRVRAFFKEAEILEAMDHKNIVKFYSFHQTDQYLLIKMELIRGGTLKKLIEKRKNSRQGFKEEEVAVVMRYLLEGIRYLHTLNVIHRDLKIGKYYPYKIENILLADDSDLSSIKIVDFGLSAKLEIHSNKNVKAQCGTLLYMAPEMFSKPSYTKSVDIWSCAVIMFMMFNQGAHPFYSPGMKVEDFKYKLKMNHFPSLNHQLAQNFIEKISKKQYQQRYNVNQALKHPWITRNKDDEIPLSIHQSFKGFDSTNQIITVLKLCLTLGSVIPHKRVEIDEFYRFKVNDFASNNEAVRVYSPSRRKVRDKNNELFVKMKQIFTFQPSYLPKESTSEHYIEQCSPTLKKHQSFFTQIFDKEKSYDQIRRSDKVEIKLIEQSPTDKQKQRQSLVQSCRFERMSIQEIENRVEEHPLSKTAYIDRDFMLKVENQIQELVNECRMKSFHDYKRRIFQKKPSFEDKEILGQSKSKAGKKYSHNYELEKNQQSTRRSETYSLTIKQVYNRKPMSPIRTHYTSKPMSFSLSNRGNSANKKIG